MNYFDVLERETTYVRQTDHYLYIVYGKCPKISNTLFHINLA